MVLFSTIIMKTGDEHQKILALIPARSGSKSIPNKNIVELAGHPLVAFSIASASMSKLINRVIVSTDSEKIQAISKSYGAEAPFLRPKEISGDDAQDIDWFNHAVNWLAKNENYSPDLVIHLRPTTPLRDYRLIDEAIQKIQENKEATALRSAQLADYTPYKTFKITNEFCDFFGRNDFKDEEEYYNLPRQVLPQTYVPNGQVDIIKSSTVKETKSLHGKKILPFITEKTPDIDELKDLQFAERIVHQKEHSLLLKKLEEVKTNAKLS